MILLYRDPYGKKLTVVAHHSRSESKPSNGVENANKTAELENKVVTLEKMVLEGERTIVELRQRIEVLTKEKDVVQVAMLIPVMHKFSLACHFYDINLMYNALL